MTIRIESISYFECDRHRLLYVRLLKKLVNVFKIGPCSIKPWINFKKVFQLIKKAKIDAN
jgi:hypothetical protein